MMDDVFRGRRPDLVVNTRPLARYRGRREYRKYAGRFLAEQQQSEELVLDCCV